MIALSVGKIYHTKIRLPLELDGAKAEALFLTKNRQLKLKVPFVMPSIGQDDIDNIFNDSAAGTSTGEALLANNFKKVQEHQLEIRSDLLNDIM